MADPRPAVQLLKQVFGNEQLSELSDLQTYLEDGGSIFPLVEMGVQGLVKHYELSADDARLFLRQANSMAIYVRRQFIEHRLQAAEQSPQWPSSGLLSLVPGPNFEQLFKPNFDDACPPQALESLASPVAYLIELLRWVRDRIEAKSDSESKLPLHRRRKDLEALSVDYNAVHRSVSSVDIILEVLETFIGNQEDEIVDAMIEARYPNGLPYFQHWTTLDEVARYHGVSVGSFVRAVDPFFPSFWHEPAGAEAVERALTHATRLGPYQRELLTEAPANLEDNEAFYNRNYGSHNTSFFGNLNQVPFFGERTKLDTPGLEALLSVRGFAPMRSANIKAYPSGASPGIPESGRFGSVYLNANSHPAVHIEGAGSGPTLTHRLSLDPSKAEDLERFDRMNRKVRLDQWLDLPSEEVDALLVAAMQAEQRGATPATEWWITEKTVCALGLFQSLRERYGCTAPDFAAFIDAFSIYGRGEIASQFDRIFNGEGDFGEPLELDEGQFSIAPEPGESDLTVTRLCSALRIDLKTYQFLAAAIANAHDRGDGTLLRSAAILSSFYRMVRLPRLLGMTPVEGILLLTLLGGEPWLNGLAGVPTLDSNPGSGDTSDVLRLINAMDTCVQWCADRNLTVLWMLQHIAPPQASAVTEAERQLFESLLKLLPAALFTHEGLLLAGVPAPTGGDWLELLIDLVDPDGLVIAYEGTEADYLDAARNELRQAVTDGLGEAYEPERPAIVESMLTVLLKARDAQASVVRGTLAVYAGATSEQALNILAWADATAYRLLRLVLERARSDLDAPPSGGSEEPGPLLML